MGNVAILKYRRRCTNKNLTCSRKTARLFVSLNISLSRSRSMKMVPFASLLGYDFPFAFHSNYGPILYHFGDKARYWSKITVFSCQHSTPPLGCPSDSCITFRVEKPEQCGYLIVRKVTACGPLYDVVTGIGRSYLQLAHLEISISISEQINSFHFRISNVQIGLL